MKKSIIALLSLVVVLTTSCLKNKETTCNSLDSSVVAPASEIAAVSAYITNAGLTGYTQHTSGLFYKIETPSTSNIPNLCSRITVTYVGKLTSGNIFDQSTNASFTLNGTIEGWRKGIPLVGKGGVIKLIIPPTLGYGLSTQYNNMAVVTIPSSSILLFDVNVKDVL